MRTIIIITVGFLFACNTQKGIKSTNSYIPSPPVYVYKTMNDYFGNGVYFELKNLNELEGKRVLIVDLVEEEYATVVVGLQADNAGIW